MRRGDVGAILTSRGWLAEIEPAMASAMIAAGRVIELRRGEALYQPGDDVGGVWSCRGWHPAVDDWQGWIAGCGPHRSQVRLVRLWVGPRRADQDEDPDPGGERADVGPACASRRVPEAARGFSGCGTGARPARDARRGDLSGHRHGPADRQHGPPPCGRPAARHGCGFPGPKERPARRPGGRPLGGTRGVPLTQTVLAELANASPHTVARFVDRAVQAAWIEWRYGRVRILDAALLAAFAAGQ